MRCPNCGAEARMMNRGTTWECPYCGQSGGLTPQKQEEGGVPDNGGCLISVVAVAVVVILLFVALYITTA